MDEQYQNISLILEIETSVKYLRIGLGEIQKISGANDFYDPLLLFLSSGLERLLKTMLCLSYRERNGKFPTQKQLLGTNNGHDIEYLKREVEKICIPINTAKSDFELITNNDLINRICKTLSNYGKQGRYFNLDAVLGKSQEFDTQKEWEQIESFVLKQHYGEDEFHSMLQGNKIDSLYQTSNNILIVKLESFIRALSRQFTLDNFSTESKKFVSIIADFLYIEDEQLGKTRYNDFKNYERIKR